MKKSKAFLFSALLILLAIFNSCKHDDFSSLNEKEKLEIKARQLYYQTNLTGKALNTVDGIVYFNDKNSQNKYTSAIALLSSTPSELNELKKLLESNIEIRYHRDYIEFKNLYTSDKILFVVSNENGHNYVHNIINKKTYKQIIFGYELSYIKNQSFDADKIPFKKIETKMALINTFSAITPELDDDSLMKCDGGGSGSTECAIGDIYSNCSVSCASGYYACCQGSDNTCKCIKIKK